MPEFYIIAQNDDDAAFDVACSAGSHLTRGVEIVALVQSKARFPPGGRIRCAWRNCELTGRVSPDCTQNGKRARAALFYSQITNKNELSPEYFHEVMMKLKGLLGNEISDALAAEFSRKLKAQIDGGLGRMKKAAAFFTLVLIMTALILLVI